MGEVEIALDGQRLIGGGIVSIHNADKILLEQVMAHQWRRGIFNPEHKVEPPAFNIIERPVAPRPKVEHYAGR